MSWLRKTGRRQESNAARRRRAFRAFCSCIVERLEPRTMLSAIVSGQTVAGDILTSGQLDTYTFAAAVGNTFEVSVGPTDSTSNYRSKVTVLGPDSSQVGAASTGFGLTSANVVYNVPSGGAGTYTVEVQTDVAGALGTYDLDLVVVPATQAADSDGDGGAITSGQTKAGTINHYGDLDVYTFSAVAGNTFQLAVGPDITASNYRPDMTVYGPTGAQVATANDGFGDASANITYSVPTGGDGTYTVVVQSDNATTLGTYDLDLVVVPATQAADSNGDGGIITSGQTKAGAINHYGDLDVYTFSAAAGNTFQLAVGPDITSSNYRPDMTVYGPTGAQVANANDGFVDASANITYSVPTGGDGTYTVVVQSDNVSTLGTYDLDLVIVPATQAPDSNGDGGVITSGQTKSGAINHYGDLDVYTFSAAAGNTVQLAVGPDITSSNYRPDMTLYGPNGAQITNANDGFGDTSANITYAVPTGGDGTYTLVVQSDNVSALGTYDLDLVIAPATQAPDSNGDGGVIASGQTKAGAINHYGDLDVYTFAAAAGNTVQLAVGPDMASSNYRPDMTLYGPNGSQLGNANDGFADTSANLKYIVPTGGDGTYTLVVQSDNVSALGTYDLDLVIAPATQAPDSDGDGGVITSGQTKTGTINHYGDLDVYTFSAAAGNTFELNVGPDVSSSNYRPDLTVYGPTGAQVATASDGFTDTSATTTYTVPSGGDGTYTVVVQSDNVSALGTYDLDLVIAPATQAIDSDGDGGVITSGQVKAGTINHFGDLDVYTFSAPAGNTFKIGVGGTDPTSNYRPSVTVYDPNGGQVATASNGFANSSVNASYAVPTGDGGTFTAIVQSDNVSALGTYDIEMIQGLTTGTITPGALTSNVPVLGRINTSGQQDSWTFFGQAGNNVTVLLNPGTASAANFLGAIAPALTWATVSLIAPDGNTVLSTQIATTSGQVLTLNGVNLLASGTYTVQVAAASTHSTSTGNYVLGVYNVTSNARPLNLNSNVVGRLAEPFTFDQYTFSAAANTQIQFNLASGSSGALTYTLTGPNGVSVFSNATASSGLLNLPADGTYTLTVQGIGGQVGNYSFNIAATSQTALTLNVPFNGTTTGNGEAQLFTVPLTGSDPVSITLTDASAFDHNELYASFSHPPTRASYDYGVNSTGASQDLLIPSGKPTTLYVLVYSDVVHPAPGSFTLLVQSAPAVLTSATPDEGAANAPTTLTLAGAGFNSSAVVSLVATNNTVYPATSSTTDLPTQVTATFAAGSVPAGTYTIQLAEGGTTTQLLNAFTMVASGQGVLTTNIEIPNPIGIHISSVLYIDYANTGTAAIPAPLLELTATQDGLQGALLTLDPALQVSGFWTSATPAGYSQSVQILAGGKIPGVLEPGESFRIPVYYAGWLRSQWDFSRPPIYFTLNSITADDATPFNWGSTLQGLQPASINNTAWSAISANLLTKLGSTTGSYVQMLDDAASYLFRTGERVTDVSKLWDFAFQQADAGISTVGSVLTSHTDISLPAPGIPLSFSRDFSNTITGRDTLGLLGYGWFTPWEMHAGIGSDGTITIFDSADSEENFQPDSRQASAYFSAPGDDNTLSADGLGGYRLTTPAGGVTDFDSTGKLLYMLDSNGNRITAGYTGTQLTSLTHSSGQSLTLAYNASGLISSIADSTGGTTTYTYNASKQLIAVQDSNGFTTTYAYGASGAATNALTAVTSAGGVQADFSYDSQGRLAGVSSNNNTAPTTFAYNQGAVTLTDALGGTTTYYFDNNGDPVKSVDALGNTTFAAYDSNFKLVAFTNSVGLVETYTYDTHGNTTSFTDFLGNTTTFAYNAGNKLSVLTDAKGNRTNYTYNSAGDLLSTAYADGSSSTSTYNPLGEATSFLNQNGQVISFTYNSAGQVALESFTDGTTYAYTYDARGNMLTATDATGTTTFTYANGLLAEVLYPGNLSLTFSYNADGQRTQMVDQTGFATNYHYDAAGRLTSLTDAGGNAIVSYTYNATGRLSSKVNGNGTSTTYAYDAAGHVLHLVNLAPDGVTVNSRFDYTYDALGNVATETTIDGAWTYTFDANGQLTHAVFALNGTNPDGLTSQDLTYNYDAVGNLTSTLLNGTPTAYTTNNLNQYTNIGGLALTYDAAGNLLTYNGNTYTYDALSNLTSATVGGVLTTYITNALGQRFSATSNGTTTQYVFDPFNATNLVAIYSNNTLAAHFTNGIGLVSQIAADGTASYFDFDNIGSTAGITNAAGAYVNRYAYNPFGQLTVVAQALANNFTFVAQSGVMATPGNQFHMLARQYDPSLARFTSMDPSALDGTDVNLYRYVRNSPLKYIDPIGLDGELVDQKDILLDNIKEFGEGLKDLGFQLARSSDIELALHPDAIVHQIGIENLQFLNKAGQISEKIFDGLRVVGNIGAGLGIANDLLHHDYSKAEYDTIKLIVLIAAPELAPLVLLLDLGVFIYQHLKTSQTKSVNSHDPNDLIGPAGYGASGFVSAAEVLPYRIDFENASTATAPAQSVTVTEQLDSNLDWTTFLLTGIGWGDFNLAIPANSQHYESIVPMTYNGETFDVQVEAGIDLATGQLYANFQSIDPNTSLPPANVLTGFLPPEDGTGRGDGYLTYSISPKSGLATGTAIRSVADITFDAGVTIATNQVSDSDPSQGTDPTKEALVTIDAGVPTSSVTALPAAQTTTSFNVAWSGSDDANGSGIAGFTIYVSDNGGAFTPWLIGTTATSAVYTGVAGHTYGFYSVAVDNAGNVEATPGSAQATTAVNADATQSTTVTLTANKPNILLAATETLTATVASPAGTPVGSVTFFDGNTPLGTVALINGTASLDVATLTFGDHTISAIYDSLITSAPLNVFVGNTSNEVIVNALYRQLLARNAEITQSGLLYWSGRLDNGDPLSVVADGIATSVEYDTDLVTGIYQQYLHRNPDPTGLHDWVGQMQAGTINYETIRGLIMGSQEFYNDMINQFGDYLVGLYQILLGRNPDATGIAAWTPAGGAGAWAPPALDPIRDTVTVGISTSFEQFEDFVGVKFNLFLGRNPSPPTAASQPSAQYVTANNPNGIPPPTDPVSEGEQGFWADALNHGTTDGDFIADILSSSEYLHDQGLA
jgi:RHS repeat-associated protein